MARSVSVSDDAFRALREEKRPGESDSDVLLRLRREARARRKDPKKFLRRPAHFDLSADEHGEFLEAMRAADRERDPWAPQSPE